jgi:ribosome biogenesis protein NSA2
MELHKKRYGKRFDHDEKTRKKEARSVKEIAAKA